MTKNICKICNQKFYARPSHVKMGWGLYCSRRCKNVAQMQDRTEVSCFTCGRKNLKTRGQMRHSKSGKYFCDKSCQTKWRNAQFVGDKHANYKNGFSTYQSILKRHKIEKVCGLCGTMDARILATHHVDENHKNNNIKNLAWLCHNCHYLVHCDNLEKQKFLKSR